MGLIDPGDAGVAIGNDSILTLHLLRATIILQKSAFCSVSLILKGFDGYALYGVSSSATRSSRGHGLEVDAIGVRIFKALFARK